MRQVKYCQVKFMPVRLKSKSYTYFTEINDLKFTDKVKVLANGQSKIAMFWGYCKPELKRPLEKLLGRVQ